MYKNNNRNNNNLHYRRRHFLTATKFIWATQPCVSFHRSLSTSYKLVSYLHFAYVTVTVTQSHEGARRRRMWITWWLMIFTLNTRLCWFATWLYVCGDVLTHFGFLHFAPRFLRNGSVINWNITKGKTCSNKRRQGKHYWHTVTCSTTCKT